MKAIKKTLPNGVRLISVPMKDATAVTVFVFAEAGARYETKNNNGISHFLEHVCFKGTVKRPTSRDINGELDSIGAQSKAFTSYEYTGYYAKAHPKHVARIVDILSDMYLNSVFPEADIEKEKGVILEEINMKEDQPQRKVEVIFDQLLYGDTPLGRSILGKKDVIRSITPADFRNYRDSHYTPDRTIVVIAGKCSAKDAEKLTQKAFASMKKRSSKNAVKVVENQKSPALLVADRESDQTHLVLGVRTFSINDKRHFTLSVLNTILGEGMSSRLFHTLREELGMCYYVHSRTDDDTDHGALVISAGVDKKRVVIAVEAIIAELKKLKDTVVPPTELLKAKEYSIGNLYLSLETSDALAGFYGLEEIVRKKLFTPADIEKKIRAVTAKDVQKLACEIFVDKGLNLAIVGRAPDKAALKRVLKF